MRRKNVGFLAQPVRSLRKKKGLTQEQAAERGELTHKHFQAIEEGWKADVWLSTLRKLAKAINISARVDTCHLWRFVNVELARQAGAFPCNSPCSFPGRVC